MIRYVIEATDDFNITTACEVVNMYDLRGKPTSDLATATACVVRISGNKFVSVATDQIDIFPVH
jgi:hypothetical protein